MMGSGKAKRKKETFLQKVEKVFREWVRDVGPQYDPVVWGSGGPQHATTVEVELDWMSMRYALRELEIARAPQQVRKVGNGRYYVGMPVQCLPVVEQALELSTGVKPKVMHLHKRNDKRGQFGFVVQDEGYIAPVAPKKGFWSSLGGALSEMFSNKKPEPVYVRPVDQEILDVAFGWKLEKKAYDKSVVERQAMHDAELQRLQSQLANREVIKAQQERRRGSGIPPLTDWSRN